MNALVILFIVATSTAKPDDDLRGFAEKVHEARRQHLSSTDGFDSFTSEWSAFLFKIDKIDDSGDEIKISGLASLPIVVTMPPDQLVEGTERVNRFHGVYKNGVLNVKLEQRMENKDGKITIATVTLNGKIENGRCRGYFIDTYRVDSDPEVSYGGIFEIGAK